MADKLRFQSTESTKITGLTTMAGTVDWNDCPKAIQEAFSDPNLRVTRVVVFHRDLNADDPEARDDFAWIFEK